MAITYADVRNPRWADKQQTMIVCEVDWDNIGEEQYSECAVVASGDMPYIHEIYRRCVAGEFGPIADYASPENLASANDDSETQPALNYFIREKRDHLLKESDLMMLGDNWSAMTAEKQQEWAAYRTALRDMTASAEMQAMEGVFNDDTGEYEPSVTITWPTKPS